LSSSASLATQFYNLAPVRRMERWLNAMPHPPLVVEIAPNHVAAARWGKTRGTLESFAVEPLPAGAVIASPVDANIQQPDAVTSAVRRVLSRTQNPGGSVALLIPDPVVRVFILAFETLPRRADDALPLLRWRLKKSVPFDVDETVVSWMRQEGREQKLEILTAVARNRIVREYEQIVETLGSNVGVVLSSTLASLPLLEDRGATLFVRLSGRTLTTVIVRSGNVCVYRSSELPAEAATLDPHAMLDEIFPAIAYYQDTWGGTVDRARLSGLGVRDELFRKALAQELTVPAGALADSAEAMPLASNVKDLVRQDLDALVGWMLNGGS
jgi:type IV pilus assembly protein PilM